MFNQALELFNEALKKRSAALLEALQPFVGRDAEIKWGKYNGRLGKITWIGIQTGISGIPEIHVMCQPYRQYRAGMETFTDPDNLLWDHVDARTCVPISKVSFVE